MTPVSRWFIKAGLLWFLVGGLLGGLFLVFKGLRSPVNWYAFVPAHGHIMFVGFVAHLIMGVAYWMFPRPRLSRYSQRLARVNLGLLNAGLALRVVFEPWQTLGGGPMTGWLVVLSGLLQFLAVAVFVYNIWDRIYFPRVMASKK